MTEKVFGTHFSKQIRTHLFQCLNVPSSLNSLVTKPKALKTSIRFPCVQPRVPVLQECRSAGMVLLQTTRCY